MLFHKSSLGLVTPRSPTNWLKRVRSIITHLYVAGWHIQEIGRRLADPPFGEIVCGVFVWLRGNDGRSLLWAITKKQPCGWAGSSMLYVMCVGPVQVR